jgi:DNA-3-methyladenine glycosylase II
MQQVVITLPPTPPYSFDLTAAYATYFRGRYGGDTFEDGVFQRLLDLGDQLCLTKVRSAGTIDSPTLEVQLIGADLNQVAIAKAQDQLAWILGINQDVTPFNRLAQSDLVLAPLVQALQGLHIPHTASVYEALVLAILGQQISSHVARVLRTLLIERYGPTLELSGISYHSFPRPESLVAAGVAGLRALGFSARKLEYILDISARVASGQLDLESLRVQSDEEVIRVLTGIRGVGLWTANWLLIRALGRTDGFPHGDLALCRTLGHLLNAGAPFKPEEALEYSQRWSPYRSYVTAYLFAAMRSGYTPAIA